MREMQKKLKEMYKEIEELRKERNEWSKEAQKVEDKEIKFDLQIKSQDINREIRKIKVEMMRKINELFEEEE